MVTGVIDYHPLVTWLEGKASNDFSQFGEDGLIAATFEKIGIKNKWCFEVGAADGEFCSNTKRLWTKDWHAVLIEASDSSYPKLALCQAPGRVFTFHKMIEDGDLDDILDSVNAPHDLDLGILDIDGQEFWIWAAMRFFPRVMLVEFCKSDQPIVEKGGKGQTGKSAIFAIGKTKGYTPVATTAVNGLFVRSDQL